ncbi:MAG: peptide deformylase [Candidatus Omnitrophica bacterium]|nr:peptide deformylase [Candidatus Omnitrophota bacterium]
MKETALKIKIFGEACLRKKSRLVQKIDDSHRHILGSMASLMYESSGIGLAAPQIGINETMIVVDAGSGLYKLINPKIVKQEGSQSMEEGCLSVPGICIKVKRAKKIIVEALDEFGNAVKIEAENLLACVFQHEIDHLRGKLIIDHASFLEKLKISSKLNELVEKAKSEKLSKSERKSCQLQL